MVLDENSAILPSFALVNGVSLYLIEVSAVWHSILKKSQCTCYENEWQECEQLKPVHSVLVQLVLLVVYYHVDLLHTSALLVVARGGGGLECI